MTVQLVAGASGDLLYRVKNLLDEAGVSAACYVGEYMHYLGLSRDLATNLLVLFVGSTSDRHPAFYHERDLVALMTKTQTQCIIVYEGIIPPFLKDDSGLNVVASFVRTPPITRPVRDDDDCGRKRCHFLAALNPAQGIATAIEDTLRQQRNASIQEAAE